MTEYEYEYYSVWKNHPNTNTNIIRFENIDRIRIRIFWYSNNIRIPNYSLTSGIKACKGTLLCSKTKYKGIQKDNLFPESPNRVYFLLVPTQYVPSVVEWMIKSLQKVKVRVKTSHLIFGYVHFHFIGWDFATFNTKNFWGGTSKKIHSVCLFEKTFNYK